MRYRAGRRSAPDSTTPSSWHLMHWRGRHARGARPCPVRCGGAPARAPAFGPPSPATAPSSLRARARERMTCPGHGCGPSRARRCHHPHLPGSGLSPPRPPVGPAAWRSMRPAVLPTVRPTFESPTYPHAPGGGGGRLLVAAKPDIKQVERSVALVGLDKGGLTNSRRPSRPRRTFRPRAGLANIPGACSPSGPGGCFAGRPTSRCRAATSTGGFRRTGLPISSSTRCPETSALPVGHVAVARPGEGPAPGRNQSPDLAPMSDRSPAIGRECPAPPGGKSSRCLSAGRPHHRTPCGRGAPRASMARQRRPPARSVS